MKKVVIVLVSVFLFADGLALLVWWTHPQGARRMGFSGRLPFGLEDVLPHPKAAPAPAPALPGGGAFPLDVRGVPEVPEAPDGDAAEGPGGCRGELACKSYCSAPNHWAECLAYCSKHPEECQSEGSPAETAVRSMEGAQGPRSGVPITGVRRQGGDDVRMHDPSGVGEGHVPAGLGGCRSMEECSDFCSKPENRQTCNAYCAKPENKQRCEQSKQILRQRGIATGPEDGRGEK